MKRKVRELLENDIDMKISDMQLGKLTIGWSVYYKEWRLESLKSAVIGHLFGSLQDFLINLELQFGEEVGDDDQLIMIFEKRLPTIKEKLNRMLDTNHV